jgi:hypothetical protein
MRVDGRILGCADGPAAADSQLKVFVLYTGVSRTLAALQRAATLTTGLNARIEVVFPQVVPYPLPLDEPAAAPSFLTRRFKTLAEKAQIEARIHVYLCRHRREALASALPPRSIVLIGGRPRWWPTREEVIGRWLRARGHRVIYVGKQSHVRVISLLDPN